VVTLGQIVGAVADFKQAQIKSLQIVWAARIGGLSAHCHEST
jgi:hypothetical protein